MTMTPIPAFPALSDRADGTYNSKAFNWATHMANTFVPELNAIEGNISALAAGGAYAFPYIFDSATADADPGVGKLRLGSATQSAATVLRIDTAILGGVDIAAVFTDLLAGTSATKGSIRLVKAGDPSKWMIFDVTGGSGSGYRNLNVSARAFSAASPFANGDALVAYVERTGDRGSDAAGACQLLGSATASGSVSQIDFLNIFTSAYDKYVIELQGMMLSTNGSQLLLRLAKVGVADGAAVYGGVNTYATLNSALMNNTVAGNFTLEIRNANDAVRRKAIGIRGLFQNTSSANETVSIEAPYDGANTVTGFRLFCSPGNISAGTVRVYGFRNV